MDKTQKATGHRQRLYQQFLSGQIALADETALVELLLTFGITRKDVRPIAERLMARFGNLKAILAASPKELLAVDGIGKASAVLLKLVGVIGGISPEADGIDHAEDSDKVGKEKQLPLFAEDKAPPQRRSSRPVPKETGPKTTASKRKLQVSNGHLLDFDHMARLVNVMQGAKSGDKLTEAQLAEATGLPARQVQNRVSIARALGLIHPRDARLSELGMLLAAHDPFFETNTALEVLHFQAAGNAVNLVWYELFNTLLETDQPAHQPALRQRLREMLAGQYSENTLKHHLSQEVFFVINAYLERSFRRLGLLQQDQDGTLHRRHASELQPHCLCAMVYAYCHQRGLHLCQVQELIQEPGSPGRLFGLDGPILRRHLDALHSRGWLRWETTHNLDQIRLRPGYAAIDFLKAFFEKQEPTPSKDDQGASLA
jgi:endonuclease III-like uncharacterized protein